MSGRAEYGIEMSEILLQRNKGKPLVVIAAIFQHSPQIFLMRKDSGIKSPQDLIGRRVMWRFDSAAELAATLKNEGVATEDIEFIELSWDINDLISKKVDAIHAYMTAQTFDLEERGVEYSLINPITYGIDFYGDCLFTTEKEIQEHPERVRAFRQASLRGWSYAMDNPEELIDILIKKYGSKASREFMRYEWEVLNKLMLPKLVEIGHMNPGRWKHIGDTFVKLGMLKPDYSLDGFMYDPNPEPDYKWVYWTIGIIAAILLIAGVCVVILILFNLRLKKAVRLQTLELTKINQQLIHDITERKKFEEDRELLNNELEQKNKELEQVIYVTSHDLRTPLVNIEGFSKELGRSINELFSAFQKGSFPEDIKNKVASIVNNDIPESQNYITTSIIKMELLLSGLLKLSRLGRTELEIEKFDMNELMSDVLSILKIHTNYSDVKIEISELPSCMGDERQINQVFSNIIGNAIKFLDSGRQGIIRISGYNDSGQSVYCVEDNGIGIAPEYQGRIFDIFHRLEPDKSEGEGLGLNIAHRAIERHNGKIRVESEPGIRSKFFVSLPNTNIDILF